jgi:hypothetical protein
MDPVSFQIALLFVVLGVCAAAVLRKMQETREFELRMFQIAERWDNRCDYRWQDRVEIDPVKAEEAHDKIVRDHKAYFIELEWRRLGAGGSSGGEKPEDSAGPGGGDDRADASGGPGGDVCREGADSVLHVVPPGDS